MTERQTHPQSEIGFTNWEKHAAAMKLVKEDKEWDKDEQIPGVTSHVYKVEGLKAINALERPPVSIHVHEFDGYILRPASGSEVPIKGDFLEDILFRPVPDEFIVDLINRMYGGQLPPDQVKALAATWPRTAAGATAIPGATAASSSEAGVTVIGWLNGQPDINSNADHRYRLFSGLTEDDDAVGFQPHGLWFNDGSARFVMTENGPMFLDYPLSILKEQGMYKPGTQKRVFIGTTKGGVNKSITVETGNEMEALAEAGFVNAFGSWPIFVEDGKANSVEQVLENIGGDYRHWYRGLFGKRAVALEVLTQAARMNPEMMADSLLNGTEIELPLTDQWLTDEGQAEILRTIAEDKVYGADYKAAVVNGKLCMPGLRPAVYNHILTGLTKEGKFVMIQVSGRKGGITGQGGLTIFEMQKAVAELQETYDLESVIESSEGRDPDNVATWINGHYVDHTARSESRWNLAGGFDRKNVTTPRDTLVRMNGKT